MKRLKPTQFKAIAHFMEKGYRAELSAHPYYRFTDKKTGQVVQHHIDHLVNQYKKEK